MSGEMKGFPDVGSPVLMRPSGDVRLNKWRSFRRGGSIDNGAGVERVLKEVWFEGMDPVVLKTATGAEGTSTFDDLLWRYNINGTGGRVEITTAGLELTAPTQAATEVYANCFPFIDNVGASRFLRGNFAVFARHSYTFGTATSCFFYTPLIDADYPTYGYYTRRSKNSQGAVNSTIGGLVAGGWTGGTETGAAMYQAGTSTADVTMIYFKSGVIANYFYGSWNTEENRWPTMEEMTLGGQFDAMSVVSRLDVAFSYRATPSLVRLVFGGGYTSSNSAKLTVRGFKIVAYE